MNISTRIRMLGALGVMLLSVTPTLPAQNARLFRVSGPAATTITAFRSDGTLVWSNALAGTNYTVQTVTSLPGGTNWVDYVQLPVTNRLNTNQIIAYNAPSGMALIPAGSFTMGDNLGDGTAGGYTDEVPLHTVYVSAFYMDQYDVTYALWPQVYNWATNHGYSFDHAGSGVAANHPVQTVVSHAVIYAISHPPANRLQCRRTCMAMSLTTVRTPNFFVTPRTSMAKAEFILTQPHQ